MLRCKKCGKEIFQDDIGCTKKLKNRGATEFFCISCLSAEYGISENSLRKQIENWREQGCMLFPPKEEK